MLNDIIYRYQSCFYQKFLSTDLFLYYLKNKIDTGFTSTLCTGMTLINLKRNF